MLPLNFFPWFLTLAFPCIPPTLSSLCFDIYIYMYIKINTVKSFSYVQLFVTPWTVVYRLLHPWGFPGKNTGVGCHFLLHIYKYIHIYLYLVWVFYFVLVKLCVLLLFFAFDFLEENGHFNFSTPFANQK